MAGDPGIGKSTLLIQAAAALARAGHRAVYISGEEAVAQVRLRAERLGLGDAPVELAAETSVEDIVATLSEGKTPRLVIIDSIQTMWTDAVEAAPGTVTQVRGSAQALIRFAKKSGAAVILVGHVTKDGQIAGPRVVEHMVDAVLSFEGEGSHQFRILRAVKNRFGPTDEIGVFEMTGARPARGRQPVRAVPVRARPRLARHRGVRRHRGHPAGAGRNPGAGGADLARHAAPRGGRLGRQPAVDGAGGAARPIAASSSAATTSISTSRAACGSSSRPPISPRRRRWSRRSPMRRCRPTRSISARCRCPARCGRWRRPRPG